MGIFRIFGIGLCLLLSLVTTSAFANCKMTQAYDSLIFDAGIIKIDSRDPHATLDLALTYKVEKMVFAARSPEDQGVIEDLSESFPDLVVDAQNPWNDGPPVSLIDELDEASTAPRLLLNISRFDVAQLQRWADRYPNLWFGLGKAELDLLEQTCLKHPLMDFLTGDHNRVVFASQDRLDSYKWTIRALKRVLSSLPVGLAHGLAYENAERLYQMAVTAP